MKVKPKAKEIEATAVQVKPKEKEIEARQATGVATLAKVKPSNGEGD